MSYYPIQICRIFCRIMKWKNPYAVPEEWECEWWAFENFTWSHDVLIWSMTGSWLLFLALIWWYESAALKLWAFFSRVYQVLLLSTKNQVQSVMPCLGAHQKIWFLLTKELVSLISISIKNLQFDASFFCCTK